MNNISLLNIPNTKDIYIKSIKSYAILKNLLSIIILLMATIIKYLDMEIKLVVIM